MTGFEVDIAQVAALMADRARAAMLAALLDGRPLAAGEAARTAGAGAQTASAHLGRLLDGGLERGKNRELRVTEAGAKGPADSFGCVLP